MVQTRYLKKVQSNVRASHIQAKTSHNFLMALLEKLSRDDGDVLAMPSCYRASPVWLAGDDALLLPRIPSVVL